MVSILSSVNPVPWEELGGRLEPQEGHPRGQNTAETPTYKLAHGMHNLVLNPPTPLTVAAAKMSKIVKMLSNFSRQRGVVC